VCAVGKLTVAQPLDGIAPMTVGVACKEALATTNRMIYDHLAIGCWSTLRGQQHPSAYALPSTLAHPCPLTRRC
jgi:hypothetical protein